MLLERRLYLPELCGSFNERESPGSQRVDDHPTQAVNCEWSLNLI